VELGLYAPEGTATDLRFTYSQAHIALSLYFLWILISWRFLKETGNLCRKYRNLFRFIKNL